MPESDCFLWYRMRCNAEFYYVWNFPRTGIGCSSLQRCVVLKCFFTASRGNNFVGGTCAPPSALLVTRIKLLKLLFINWHFFRSFHSFELLFNSNTLQFCFCVLLFHHCLLYCNINVDIIIIIINTALIKVTLSCHIAGALYKIRQKKTNKGTEEVLMLIVRSREQYCHCLCRTAIKTIVLFVCFLYRAVF